MRIPHQAIILVCDAKKALLLSNHGDPDLPDLRVVEALEAGRNPKTAEQGSDRPGRYADSAVGTHRSAIEGTDWHAQAETAFAGRVAEFLARHHERLPHAPIVIAAPPRMLGDLRRFLPAPVTKATIAELDKDLVHLPSDALERALTA